MELEVVVHSPTCVTISDGVNSTYCKKVDDRWIFETSVAPSIVRLIEDAVKGRELSS